MYSFCQRLCFFSFFLVLVISGCSSEGDGGGSKSVARKVAPFVISSALSINAENKANFSLSGDCAFSGEVTLRFWQAASENADELQQSMAENVSVVTEEDDGSVTATVSCESSSWSVNVTELGNFEDGDVNLEILKDGKNLIPAVTLIKDTEVPTFSETSSFTGTAIPIGDPKVSFTGDCNEDGEISITTVKGLAEETMKIFCENGSWEGEINFSDKEDGDYTIEISFTDKAGNAAAVNVMGTVKRDTQAPSFAIDSLSSSPLNSTNSSNYAVGGDCENGLTISVQVGASQPLSNSRCISLRWSQILTANLPEGSHTITVVATDLSGNTGEAQGSFLKDTIVPEIQGEVSPPAVYSGGGSGYDVGALLKFAVTFSEDMAVNGSPRIPLSITPEQGTATDVYAIYNQGESTATELAFIYTVEAGHIGTLAVNGGIEVNGGSIEDVNGNPLATVDSLSVPTSFSNGVVIAAEWVRILSITPTITGAKKSGASVTFTATFSETVDVMGSPRLTLNIGEDTSQYAEYTGQGESNTFTVAFDFTVGTDDENEETVTVTGIDLNGGMIMKARSSESVLRGNFSVAITSFSIDNTDPSVTIDNPSSSPINLSNVSSYTVQGSCENGVPLFVQVNESPASSVSCSSSRWLKSLPTNLADGTHQVVVTATDEAGNEGQARASVFKDTIVPAIQGEVGVPVAYSGGGDGYDVGALLKFTVTFSEDMRVTGAPRIPLTVTPQAGTATEVYATYNGSDSMARDLAFIYTVEAGHIGTLAVNGGIELNGGTIKDSNGNPLAVVPSLSVPTSFSSNVAIAAQRVGISSITPTITGAKKSGASVTFTATFSEAVDVTGNPRLTLDIDGATSQYAEYKGQGVSDVSTVDFDFTVGTGDDNEVTVTGIDLNSGTIVKEGSSESVSLSNLSVAITSFSIDNTDPSVTIDDLSLSPINLSNVNSYTVQGDCDNGVLLSVQVNESLANSVSCSSSRWLKSLPTNLADGTHQVVVTATDEAGNEGEAQADVLKDTTVPTIEGNVGVPVAHSGQGYDTGDLLKFTVTFSEDMRVTSSPRIPLTVTPPSGTATDVYAIYNQGESTARALAFIYTVEAGHIGTLAVNGGIELNGATIKDSNGNPLTAVGSLSVPGSFSSSVVIAAQRVGISSITPTITGAKKSGASVTFTATFSEAVDVTGNPRLTLDIDGATSQYAEYKGQGVSDVSTVDFDFTVGTGDDNEVTVTGIDLNSGTIVKEGSSESVSLSNLSVAITSFSIDNTDPSVAIDDPSLSPINLSNVNSYTVQGSCDNGVPLSVQVDASQASSISCSSSRWLKSLPTNLAEGTRRVVVTATDEAGNEGEAQADVLKDTTVPTIEGNVGVPVAHSGQGYDTGDLLKFTVTFSEDMRVTSSPRIPLTVTPPSGTATDVYATYNESDSTPRALAFIYTVEAGHIGILAVNGGIELNGASIKDSNGNPLAVVSSLSVPGSFSSSVVIAAQRVGISSIIPTIMGAKKSGASVTFTATFSEAVDVTGNPRLTLDIDGATSQYAEYKGQGVSDVSTVDFDFTVGTGDDNEVTVTGIDLNSGTIVKEGSSESVSLSNFSVAITSFSIDNTDPSVAIDDPSLSPINLSNVNSYTVQGSCDNGVPLSVQVDASQASSISCSSSRWLKSLPTNLAEGTRRVVVTATDEAGNEGEAQADVLKDTTVPTIEGNVGVPVAHSGQGYDTGDLLKFTVTFSEDMRVTSSPRIPLTVTPPSGTATDVYAIYNQGESTATELAFIYTVEAGHIGTLAVNEGIELNGATIKDSNGNPLAAVGSLSVPTSFSSSVVIAAQRVGISSIIPTIMGAKKSGASVTFTATFSEAVDVTGNPRLTLDIDGGTSQYAEYKGQGVSDVSTVDFDFTVGTGDDNEVTVTGIDLNSGTIVKEGSSESVSLSNFSVAITSFSIDNTAPQVQSFVASPGGSQRDGSSITIGAIFGEEVTVVGAPGLNLEIGVGGSTARASFAGTLNHLATTQNFTYTVGSSYNGKVYGKGFNLDAAGGNNITDAAGNQAANPGSALWIPTLVVDNTAPVVTITSNQDTWTWNWACDDAADGCTFRFLLSISSAVQDSELSGKTYSSTALSATVEEGGTYYLHVQAKDAAGNVVTTTASDSITFVPPRINNLQASGLGWSWGCIRPSCAYRYAISSNAEAHVFVDESNAYASGASAKFVGAGSFYLHVQTQSRGRESVVETSPSPTVISQYVYSSFALGGFHGCITTNSGSLRCWGSIEESLGSGNGAVSGSLGALQGAIGTASAISASNFNFTGILQMTAGLNHSCFLKVSEDGARKVYCSGSQDAGNLGNGVSLTASLQTPAQVGGASGLSDFIQIDSSWYHTCGVRSNGQLVCWGKGGNGALGDTTDGTPVNRASPVSVLTGTSTATSRTPLEGISQVSTGFNHTCALHSDGKVSCWGQSAYGQTGHTATQLLPKLVSTLNNMIQVEAGEYFSCALQASGGVKCWGREANGRLGNGNDGTSTFQAAPVSVEREAGTNLSGIIQISLGQRHACALHSDGSVWCWGRGELGQLGDGDKGTGHKSSYATKVEKSSTSGDYLSGIREIALGHVTSCGVDTFGKVLCWGRGGYCRLGNNECSGSNVDKSYPAFVLASTVATDFQTLGGDSHQSYYCTSESNCAVETLSYSFPAGATTQGLTGASSSVEVSGLAGRTINFYGSKDCTDSSLGTLTSDGPIDVAFGGLSEGKIKIYHKVSQGAAESNCSKTFITGDLDTTPPGDPSGTVSVLLSIATLTVEGGASGDTVKVYLGSSTCDSGKEGEEEITSASQGISFTTAYSGGETFYIQLSDGAGNTSACVAVTSL